MDHLDQASKSAAFSGPPAHDGRGPAGPPEPHWTDDRAWISDIVRAPDAAAKLAVLADWIARAGGETVDRTVMLPALRPRHERRLAEVELRRMCRQAGIEILEDEA